MKSSPHVWRGLLSVLGVTLTLLDWPVAGSTLQAAETTAPLTIGLARRDVTPEGSIWLAGYAARTRPSEKVDSRLLAQAVAFRTGTADPVVMVSLDNCEVSGSFTAPVLRALMEKRGLGPGRVIIISSHTHYGPVLEGPLMPMYHLFGIEREKVEKYGRFLQDQLVDVVGAALDDLQPATLEQGIGRATFAVNRRLLQGDKVLGGENMDGPADWDVPVLRIKGTDNAVRAILYGYACHGTSIAGDDFYTVSGDYMAYTRQHLEALYPGAMAVYVTGMGADSNPAPRGHLLNAKRHGLELAGAVLGVLDRPMRPISGTLRFAFREVDLPLAALPSREQLAADAQSTDVYIKHRAQDYLAMLDQGQKLPTEVKLPVAAIGIGHDLTFVAVGGEVVVDYAKRLKRMLAADHPWMIGYAYEVPCYIPSARILKEGGYEADTSLIYYGLYGPFRGAVEQMIISTVMDLAAQVRQD